MKIQAIKKLLSSLYYRGIHDGLDIPNNPRDKFMGNTEHRLNYEKNNLQECYKKLRKFL